MSMDTSQGFLSSGMVAAIPFVRQRNAGSFALADEVNLLGMDTLPKLKVHRDDTLRVIAATMFGRILMSYQAAIVLLERGLAGDAGTIVRAMGEAAIILAAVDEPGMVQLLALREVRIPAMVTGHSG